MPSATPLAAHREGIFPADDGATELAQVHGYDLAGVGCCKGHALLAGAAVLENRGEQAFAGQQALACAHELAEEAALLGTIAKDGVHGDAFLHVHHHAGFADGGFSGVEFHLDVLHLGTKIS